MKLVKTLAVAALAFSSMATQASMITVGGVSWDPDAGLDFQGDSGFFKQNIISALGQELSGYGLISTINGNATVCNGCELTFAFDSFIAAAIGFDSFSSSFSLNSYSSTGKTVNMFFAFTGGSANLYSDVSQDWNPANASTASNGNNWLSLEAANNIFPGNYTFAADLTLAYTGNTLLPFDITKVKFDEIITGQGIGYFNVTGGTAAFNLDTDSQLGGTDIYVSSNFGKKQTSLTDGDNLHFSGNSVPAPSSLAVLGLGLLGLAGAARRKQAK